MGSPLPDRYSCAAVIFPGILFGTIIWAFIWAGDNNLILDGTRADRFSVTAYIIAPVLLAGAGALAEIIRARGGSGTKTMGVPYLAGFLGAFIAISLLLVITGMDQYLPWNPPGVPAGLTWAVGHLIFCLPLVIPVSAIFAVFSLFGSFFVQGMTRSGKNPPREEKSA